MYEKAIHLLLNYMNQNQYQMLN